MSKVYFIQESLGTPKELSIISKMEEKVIFKAILQTADEPNINGRVYPKEVIEAGLSQMLEDIKARNFVGELDHPESEDEGRLSRVLYKESSHIITDYWWQGNELWATIETLYTTHGKNMAGLVRDNVKVGFSLRAFGGIEHQHQYNVVTLPITMIAYDCVSNPSHRISRIQEITQENVRRIIMENRSITCKDGVCRFSNLLESKIDNNINSVISKMLG